jgi:lysophospholipase L1-like esterase
MKILKECPMLVGIVTVAAVLSIVSFALMGTSYSEYADSWLSGKTPALALFFRGASDGVFPWSGFDGDSTGMMADVDTPAVMPQNPDPLDADITDQDPLSQEAGITSDINSGDVADVVDASPGEIKPKETESGPEEEAEKVEEEVWEDRIYEFTEVDDEYFNDALFIGDSRTVGLSEYCEALDTRATFYSKISLTIYSALSKEFIRTGKGRISIEEALSENQFGKIYIMLGLNEIGVGDSQYFKEAYAQVIERIKELQPNAIIYIQGIMHVTAAKSNNDKYFNNANINVRNEAIAELADQKRVFYINLNEALDDENGNLSQELSFDDIHLKAASYEKWHEFLLHNAIVR